MTSTNRALVGRYEKSIGGEASSVNLIRGDAINMRPVPWLWNEWLVAGGLTVLAGRQGTGKTTVGMALAATVTIGGRWPDGTSAEVGNVCIWSGEDDPAYTLGPRLALSGADMERVFFVEDVFKAGERRAFDPATDMEPLRRALAEAGGCKLLIVDPIVSAVAGDSHKNAEVRRGLRPVIELAERLGCGLLGITHLTKGTEGRDPTDRVTGSLAFGALARTVLMVAKCRSDGGAVNRVLARSKNNLGGDTGGFEFEIEQGEVHGAPGVFASRVLWGPAIEGEARDLMADAESTAESDGGGNEVVHWLVSYLQDRGGQAPKKEILIAAKHAGFNERKIERARRRANVRYEVQGFGGDKQSIWMLPNESNRAKPEKNGSIGENGSIGGDAREQDGAFPQSCQSSQPYGCGATDGAIGAGNRLLPGTDYSEVEL